MGSDLPTLLLSSEGVRECFGYDARSEFGALSTGWLGGKGFPLLELCAGLSGRVESDLGSFTRLFKFWLRGISTWGN